MTSPFIGEIRMFAGNFAPTGWMFCEGQLLAIADNVALFSLIGTTYGGDGQSTFALPDLRGRVPIHAGFGYVLAESGGVEEIRLTANQMPAHRHLFAASSAPSRDTPAGNALGSPAMGALLYSSGAVDGALDASAGPAIGGGQPHSNFMPYLCTNFIISLFGIYPSPN
jgi:microcystin-dependent protein